MTSPIVFMSDFGLDDEFVGVVHGVLAKLAPESRIIDLTHGVPRGAIRMGALALTRAIQYLPEGVVLAVVDPGVGTHRRALAAETSRGVFVGPDNGLLGPAIAIVGGASRVVAIENPEARLPSPGATFHGRDVFAPAAALVASGEAAIDELGPEIEPDTVMPLLLPFPESAPGRVSGETWWLDGFGNAQTNIGPDDLTLAGFGPGDLLTVAVGSRRYEVPWLETYADVGEGELVLHVDSAGLMALAVRGGRADERLGLTEGGAVAFLEPEVGSTGSPAQDASA